jgi:hypothetical protein
MIDQTCESLLDDGSSNERNSSECSSNDGIFKKWAGWMLVILSFVFYGCILLLQFAPITGEHKVIASAALVVLGEASFWIAVIILGKEAVSKYRKIDWRRKIEEWFKI